MTGGPGIPVSVLFAVLMALMVLMVVSMFVVVLAAAVKWAHATTVTRSSQDALEAAAQFRYALVAFACVAAGGVLVWMVRR